MGRKINKWLNNSQFELQEARALRQMPSRSLQDLVGDHVQRQTRNRTTLLTLTMRPSARCCPSLRSGFSKNRNGKRAEKVRDLSSCAQIRPHDCFRIANGNTGQCSI